jgi:RNA polymerase sigma factor (sigma-70 family)
MTAAYHSYAMAEVARQTPLRRLIDVHGIRVGEIVRAADAIAGRLGVDSISRRHLGRLLRGSGAATEDKIFIVTAAVRELTGEALKASELFNLEPASVERAPVPPIPETTSPAETFEKLYVEYGVLLRAIAMRGYRIPPDDAEALVHDAFMAYLQRQTIIHNAKAWLSATVRNRCMNYWRDRRHETPLLPKDEETADGTAQSKVESCIRHLSAAAVLARLGEKCRETLRGHFISEESKESLADRLVASPAYIERLISRCRQRAVELYRELRGGRLT